MISRYQLQTDTRVTGVADGAGLHDSTYQARIGDTPAKIPIIAMPEHRRTKAHSVKAISQRHVGVCIAGTRAGIRHGF